MGTAVGDGIGSCVGFGVGNWEGVADGAGVGAELVGAGVGRGVGKGVGFGVGTGVGTVVGTSVYDCSTSQPHWLLEEQLSSVSRGRVSPGCAALEVRRALPFHRPSVRSSTQCSLSLEGVSVTAQAM